MMPNTHNNATTMAQDMPVIDIVMQAGGWPDELEISSLARKAVSVAIEVAGLKFLPEAELSIVLSNDQQVQSLNKTWRDIDKPTNVLSFPVEKVVTGEVPGILLGDIVLSIETITREAKGFGISFNHHLVHLVIHGFLHIFGYDHIEDKDAEVMEALEITCLAQLGITNPYTASIV